MKKTILIFILTYVVSATLVFSQNNELSSHTRFIQVDDLSTFFIEKGDYVEVNSFYIQDFGENESSKPEQIAVNDIENVIKFGISSNSEQYHKQRRCYIHMKKTNFQKTFHLALSAMNVSYVKYQEQKLTLNEFYKLTINH